ncbi:RagB/SusD family nutrient uptake outer membrane protein [Bacteroides sp. OttesenSCG-928-N06]|nr:RagB/SusD family nutrient uptake outer membrane protein [Bacteroides sp. OttesenSCG-928-N06]
MKRLILTTTIIALVLCIAGCEDFLDTTNYKKKDSSNFPISQTDAEQMVTGIYADMISVVEKNVEQLPFFVAYLASDETFGGGSTSNIIAQAFDRMLATKIDEFGKIWEVCYSGIFRANSALESIPNIDEGEWKSTADRDHLMGQAHFLRAFYYWQLADLFETVPLVLKSEPVNLPRASADEIFGQIASDLLEAIRLMNNQKYGEFEKGRTSKWTAQAYLARIFMFYTGFYKKDSMPTADGGSVTKQQVIENLNDCIANSGYSLVPDPRNIWPYANQYTKWHYKFSIDNDLNWTGNGDQETMWNIRFNYFAGSQKHNRVPEFFGLRYQSGGTGRRESFPYGQGYTNGTVNTRMVEEWAGDPNYGEADKRLWGSVLDTKAELPDHQGDATKEVERTWYHGKKYIVVTCFASPDANPAKDSPYNNYSYIITEQQNHNQYGNRDDLIYMRFADVLLMHSELTGTVDGINKVRARAGLSPIAGYSFEALQKERKFELAFEGIRWNDLRRWYPDTAGDIIEAAQKDVPTQYRAQKNVPYQWHQGNGFAKRYKETRGFWRIPDTQINLSNGVLEQSPGWEDDKSWMFATLPYKF